MALVTTKEMFEIIDIIKPLFKKGQSVYQIVKNHPELNISVKSLYTYIILKSINFLQNSRIFFKYFFLYLYSLKIFYNLW